MPAMPTDASATDPPAPLPMRSQLTHEGYVEVCATERRASGHLKSSNPNGPDPNLALANQAPREWVCQCDGKDAGF